MPGPTWRCARRAASTGACRSHSRAAEALDAYLEAAGIGETPKAALFQAIAGKRGELAGHA